METTGKLLGIVLICLSIFLIFVAVGDGQKRFASRLTVEQLEMKCERLESAPSYGYDGGYDECWNDNKYRLSAERDYSPGKDAYGLILSILLLYIPLLGGYVLIHRRRSGKSSSLQHLPHSGWQWLLEKQRVLNMKRAE